MGRIRAAVGAAVCVAVLAGTLGVAHAYGYADSKVFQQPEELCTFTENTGLHPTFRLFTDVMWERDGSSVPAGDTVLLSLVGFNVGDGQGAAAAATAAPVEATSGGEASAAAAAWHDFEATFVLPGGATRTVTARNPDGVEYFEVSMSYRVPSSLVGKTATFGLSRWRIADSDGYSADCKAPQGAGAVSVPVTYPVAGFVDVPRDAYYTVPVDWAAWTGVTTGIGGGNTFAPALTNDRAMALTMLWRLAGSPTGHGPHGFVDVPAGTYYEQALRWAKATGVTTGVGGSNRFAPNDTVTRSQLVTLIWRIGGSKTGHGAHGFVDVPAGTFYEQALRWAKATGVTTGVGGSNRFAPDGELTRAEAVTFLYRAERL